MVQNYTVWVEKKAYPVVVSDERKALLAAKAAGRAFVGLIYLEEDGGGSQQDDICDAEYLATPDAICPEYLERIVRRHIGLPWIITETDRFIIREFTVEDIAGMPEEPDVWFTQEEREDDQVFYDAEKLKAYIKNQYRFYEYGIWALVRKTDGRIIGKAGLSNAKERDFAGANEAEGQLGKAAESGNDFESKRRADSENGVPDANGMEDREFLELGYHIFRPYRRQGYAEEACRAILDYAKIELECPVCACVAEENTASIRLLRKLQVKHYLSGK